MTRRTLIAVVMLMLALTFAAPSGAQGGPPLQELRTEGLTIAFPEALGPEAQRIAAIYPELRRELEAKLGLPANIDHTMVIVANYETFVQAAGTNLIVAYANGSRRLVAMDYTTMATRPDMLADTLKHELCHVVLHEHVYAGPAPSGEVFLPRWLNEGVCQWASGGANELITLGQGSELERAVLGNRLIPLYRLERAFPSDARGLRLAYEESRSAVEYIAEREGPGAILTILGHIREGRPIDQAIRQTLGMTHQEFEDAWHASLRRKHTWVTWLSNHLDLLLFAAGGALLVLGFGRALWRMARYKAQEEEELLDNKFAPPPPGQSPHLRRLRSRMKGRHVQDGEDDAPRFPQ